MGNADHRIRLGCFPCNWEMGFHLISKFQSFFGDIFGKKEMRIVYLTFSDILLIQMQDKQAVHFMLF